MEQGSGQAEAAPPIRDENAGGGSVTPDRVRYNRKQVSYAGPHTYCGVQIVRLSSFGSGQTIRAERPAGDRHGLLLLSRGSGHKVQANLAGERYSCSGNRDLRASFVPDGAEAWMEFGVSARAISIRFPSGLLAQYLSDGAPRQFAPVVFDSNPALIGLATMLDLAIVRPAAARDLFADQVMRSIALILGGIDTNGLAASSPRIALTASRVRRVVDYIEAHLHERLTLDTLAETVGFSPFHFARAFKDATGVSPYRYVCDRRLLKAQRMLIAGHEPLGEVARACGFGSPSHFSAAFTRSRQISPREYRSQFGFA